MRLIIVESPTKQRTIKKFLGKGYKLESSFGHIRDLPKSELGVDTENNFKPKYVIPPKSRKVISSLKKEVKKAGQTILATDEDREGEAIAWHLSKVLELENPERIVFHEITKPAIEKALQNPRELNLNLVNAQQARRILDRIVGYKLSPFLWKKVARRLSAGRVQSVAVRLVAEREKEIEKFKPEEYWMIEALLQSRKTDAKLKYETNTKNEFLAKLIKKDEKTIPKLGIKTQKEADEVIKDLKEAEYIVENVEKKETKRNPFPPFATSTLQQDAWQKLRFSAKKTMMTAQRLYEKGFISYHRTDSLNLSRLSLSAAKKFIQENYGKNYWPGYFRKYKAKGKTQEAHEAIRPTFPGNTPEKLQDKLDNNQQKLYKLIWQRFIASQMAPALFDSTKVDIKAKNYGFRGTGQILKFDGFLKVYPVNFKESEIPDLKKEDILKLLKLIPSQHFTQPLPRYTEASLIKVLEENGIGRPSTYASILSTIQLRNYVEKKQGRLYPTEIGLIVNDLLVEHFPKIVDIKFTAKMEEDLDKIAQGEEKWTKVAEEFYKPFDKNLQNKYQEVKKKDITEKPTNKKCPKCGAPLIVRLGKYGKFYACSKFPECKYTEPLEKKTLGIKCPKCGKGEIIEKRTKSGKIFYACNQWPKCDFALWDKPTGEKCPKCGSLLVEKGKKIVCSNKACPAEKR